MAYVPYEKILKDLLEHNYFFRHLFSKAKEKKPVKIVLESGDVIEGILKNVDAYFRGLEVLTSKGVVYINWRHVVKLEILDIKEYEGLIEEK